MANEIAVAGATGNLGKRIVRELLKRDAKVIALVRMGAQSEKIEELSAAGAAVQAVDLSNADQIARVLKGVGCVVSALAGLRGVIVNTQTILLHAAIQAGVGRFIPSDFSTDFTKLPAGENRNFDLRREFHQVLDSAPIRSTAIFNGAFAEMLNYNIPVLDFKKSTVAYWEDPGHLLDFTTMDNTAAYTAAAALDSTTPPVLRIASFRVSPNDLVRFTAEVLKTPFALVRMGTLEELRAYNKSARAANPEGENELYCRWQQSQYVQSMFSTTHESLDNARYPDLQWTRLEDFIRPRS